MLRYAADNGARFPCPVAVPVLALFPRPRLDHPASTLPYDLATPICPRPVTGTTLLLAVNYIIAQSIPSFAGPSPQCDASSFLCRPSVARKVRKYFLVVRVSHNRPADLHRRRIRQLRRIMELQFFPHS